MKENEPRVGEIWLANVPFDEGVGEKIRPALVLVLVADEYIIGKMTSHAPRPQYPYEYALQAWRESGLARPTTLRLSQRPRIKRDRFLKKIGEIQAVDLIEIAAMLTELGITGK